MAKRRPVVPTSDRGSFVYRSGGYHFRFYDRPGHQRSIVVARGDAADPRVVKKAMEGAQQALKELDMTGSYTPERMTFSEVWERFIAEGGKRGKPYKPKTRMDYEYIYKQYLEDYFGNRHITNVDLNLIAQYRKHLENLTGGDRRKDQSLLLLKSILSYANSRRLITYNPGVLFQVNASGRRPRVMLDKVQTDALIAETDAHWRPLTEGLLYLGLRINEAVSLKWQDIDLREGSKSPDAFGVVSISRGMSGKEIVPIPKTSAAYRDIPIPPRLQKTLLELRDWQREQERYSPEGWVFQDKDGEQVRPDYYRKVIFKNAKERAGITSPLVVHDLRGIYLSWLSENSVPPEMIKRIGGHESFSTSLRYITGRSKQLKAIVDIFKDD